jgi:hypothetical protein
MKSLERAGDSRAGTASAARFSPDCLSDSIRAERFSSIMVLDIGKIQIDRPGIVIRLDIPCTPCVNFVGNPESFLTVYAYRQPAFFGH